MRLHPLPLDLEPERSFNERVDVGARKIEVGENAAAVQTGSCNARGRSMIVSDGRRPP